MSDVISNMTQRQTDLVEAVNAVRRLRELMPSACPRAEDHRDDEELDAATLSHWRGREDLARIEEELKWALWRTHEYKWEDGPAGHVDQ